MGEDISLPGKKIVLSTSVDMNICIPISKHVIFFSNSLDAR
jgi:hypothetical protein